VNESKTAMKKNKAKNTVKEIEAKYQDDQKLDEFQQVMMTAIETLDSRQEYVERLIATRRNEGENCSHLEEDIRLIKARSESFYTSLTVYNDLQKLNRVSHFDNRH